MKQVIVIRKDLKVGKGKLIVQGAHASLLAYQRASWLARWRWLLGAGQKKVVVGVASLDELLDVAECAEEVGVPYAVVKDAARTSFAEPTYTAVGVGPAPDFQVDVVTGELKLL